MTRDRPGDQQRPLTVLQSFPGRGPQTNPYLLQLVDALPSSVSVHYFSWRRALFGRWEVLHVHWPERLIRAAGPVRTRVRRLLFLLLLARLRVFGGAVVRTVHNVAAHEGSDRPERRLLERLDARTDLWIRLNPYTELPSKREARTIVHGHYRDWYPTTGAAAVAGRILFVGLVRPYKGVIELIEAFRGLSDDTLTLHVCGRPSDDATAGLVEAAASGDPRITLRLRHVDDTELVQELGEAQLVALPYRSVHNSGAALLAVSLSRPVLMPSMDVTEWLRGRVGEEWVHLYAAPLTSAALASTLDDLATAPGTSPALSDMEWKGIGIAHADAYRSARDARAQ